MKPALLLIDIQGDYLGSPGLQPPQALLVARAAGLLEQCRRRKIPVVHVWTTVRREQDRRLPHWKKSNRWLCVAGTAGHETPPALKPQAGEFIIHKSGFNAFADGELSAVLERLNCDTAILAGLHLHACVRTAAVECLERALAVWICAEAVGSNDPMHAASSRRWLVARCVDFAPMPVILSRLDGAKRVPLIHRSPRKIKSILFEVKPPNEAGVSRAANRALDTWKKWRATDKSGRAGILERFARALEMASSGLARQMAMEIGKPVSHGREEVARAAANVRDAISRAAAFGFQRAERGGLVRHEPVGVVGLISPWNNPVAIPVGKLAPALLYGNTVLWKPAPAAARIAEVLRRMLHDAGLPSGTVEVLNGDQSTAQALATDGNIGAVTLTGSTAAGHAIQEICARRFVPFQAELGGNNAAIVWDGTNAAAKAAQIAWGAFGFAGQRCTANRRVIVSAKHCAGFVRELKAAAEKLQWGDPLDEKTDIGPVINAAKREEHDLLVRHAVNSRAACDVERLFETQADKSWAKDGTYAQPVIVVCDEPDNILVQEETMSPLLVVQCARSFDEALELCNGVRHGLAAALFSKSAKLREKFLAEAKAGILKINCSTAGADISMPFGGWKMSGFGPPEHGDFDAAFYTRPQAVYG